MKAGVERDYFSPVHVNPVAPAGVERGTVSRIARQRDAIWRVVGSGGWYSLDRLAALTGFPQASISARLRDFRKDEYGSHTVERRRAPGASYYLYRVTS